MSGARVTGGRYRGRRIVVPAGVRPTAARTREALFSIWGERLQDGPLLDLFAGSCLIGVEALGRGASRVVGLERSRRVLEQTRAQLDRLGIDGLELRRANLPAEGARALAGEAGFPLVFADPPYAFERVAALLEAAVDWLLPGGSFALEQSVRSERPSAPPMLARAAERTYGETRLTFFEKPSD